MYVGFIYSSYDHLFMWFEGNGISVPPSQNLLLKDSDLRCGQVIGLS